MDRQVRKIKSDLLVIDRSYRVTVTNLTILYKLRIYFYVTFIQSPVT